MRYHLSSVFRRDKKNEERTKETGVVKTISTKDLDKKLVFGLRKSRIPNAEQLKHLPKFLNPNEKKILRICFAVMAIALIGLGSFFYKERITLIPNFGGEYTEGLVGQPQYVNPILGQTSDVDRDLTRLVFSSLLQYDEKQNLVADLANRYEISDDQKTYTIHLREGVKWHDGADLNADDVLFTVKAIQDSQYRSPLAASFRGVEVNKVDDVTITFTLAEPFAPFLEILTFGILPRHIWSDIPPANARLAEYNLKAVGSGPFQFLSFSKDKTGTLKSYTLTRNESYYKGRPYVEKLTFKFYPDFPSAIEALNNKNIEGVSFLPKTLVSTLQKNKNLKRYSFQIPQYTALFFNQRNNEILKDKTVKKALALSIDKEAILNQTLGGEGVKIDSPILPGFIGYNPDLKKYEFNRDEANRLLDEAKWTAISAEDYKKIRIEEEVKKLKAEEEAAAKAAEKAQKETPATTETSAVTEATETNVESETPVVAELSPEERIVALIESELSPDQLFFRKKGDEFLSLSLSTVDQPENVAAVELIKKEWESIGVRVTLHIYSPAEIRGEIIRERKYETLLYAEIVGSDPDPYPFWHSSQNAHPGLNLAIFTNRHVDELLEQARQTNDSEERRLKYVEFQNILTEELPAIFLYSPTYTYAAHKKVLGVSAERLTIPADRFVNVERWYIKTKRKFQ